MSLVLVIEEDSRFRECIDCGDEIPDPYLEDEDDEDEVLCSSCDAERIRGRRLKRLEIAHLKPFGLGEAICECGKLLVNCTIATCTRPEPPPRQSKKAKKQPQERQRKLF